MAQHGRHSRFEPSFANSGYKRRNGMHQSGQGMAGDALTRYYSRDNYGRNATGAYARPIPRRRRAFKRALITCACVLAVAVFAVGVSLFCFSTMLNEALAPSAESSRQLEEVLVDSPLNQPFYMLLLGSDSREGSGTSSNAAESGDQERSDVIILARVDAPAKKVTLISVPRDTPYKLEDGSVVKVNEAYNIGGAAMSLKAVSDITGVEIAHYAEVHLSGLEAIVDSLGGVEVYVDRPLAVKNTLTGEMTQIDEGLQQLNGKEAQAFARDRHSYDGSSQGQDASRQSNVRTLLEAIVKKILGKSVVDLPETVLNLAQYVTTDLKAGDLVMLGASFSGGKLTMYSCTGPTDGDFFEEYDGQWLCYPNPEGWAELIRQADEGIEPQGIDYAATQQTL